MRRMTSYSSDIWRVGGSGCVGQDSNLGTPSGRDLESLAFDRAWLPTRSSRDVRGRKTFSRSAPACPGFAKAYFIEDGPAGAEPLAQYFTQTFFQEVANRLNA